MSVTIKYFAAMRDFSNKNEEKIPLEFKTAGDLFETLRRRYKIDLAQDQIRVAVNEMYVEFEHKLQNGDTVVFIPPVAGG